MNPSPERDVHLLQPLRNTVLPPRRSPLQRRCAVIMITSGDKEVIKKGAKKLQNYYIFGRAQPIVDRFSSQFCWSSDRWNKSKHCFGLAPLGSRINSEVLSPLLQPGEPESMQ